MAVDMFIKFTPTVKGESSDSKHKDEIDVLSWSWGASQSGTTHMGGGGGSGKVNVQDLSFTKWCDAASAPLMLAVCNGAHHDEVVLTCRKAGKTQQEFLKITMKEVIVTSVSHGGSQGEDRLTENVSLNFAEFKVEYSPQKPDGSLGAAITAAYNMAENKEG